MRKDPPDASAELSEPPDADPHVRWCGRGTAGGTCRPYPIPSGNSTMYGITNSAGVTVCTRDMNGNIVYQGDWCTATNAAATATCADAVQLNMPYAASVILITN